MLTVGGVRNLAEFSPEEITLSVGGGYITISGESLEIQRFDENEIQIKGKITCVATEITKRSRGGKNG